MKGILFTPPWWIKCEKAWNGTEMKKIEKDAFFAGQTERLILL